MIGSQLGPYKIEAPIGAGGMGEVFRAHDTRLRRTVAIKVLQRERVADPERKRRFLQEARAASSLNHPNIVTLHDIANDSGVDYLVMEYVPGTRIVYHTGQTGDPIFVADRTGANAKQIFIDPNPVGTATIRSGLRTANGFTSCAGIPQRAKWT